MTIFTGVPWQCFKELDGSGLHKCGGKYEEIMPRNRNLFTDLLTLHFMTNMMKLKSAKAKCIQ